MMAATRSPLLAAIAIAMAGLQWQGGCPLYHLLRGELEVERRRSWFFGNLGDLMPKGLSPKFGLLWHGPWHIAAALRRRSGLAF